MLIYYIQLYVKKRYGMNKFFENFSRHNKSHGALIHEKPDGLFFGSQNWKKMLLVTDLNRIRSISEAEYEVALPACCCFFLRTATCIIANMSS